MIVGVAVGYFFPDGPNAKGFHATDLQVLSTVFLRMIKSVVAPLLFATLVVGIAGHGDDMKRIGKLAFRSIFYFEVVTTLALVVGLLAVNIVKPGRGVNLSAASATTGMELAQTKTLILATNQAAGSPISVRRAEHRREHLDEIERALATAKKK